MATNTTVRAKIDGQLNEEAEAVLASIGLSVSDAFRLMMVRIAKEKALPFAPLVPNKAKWGQIFILDKKFSIKVSSYHGQSITLRIQYPGALYHVTNRGNERSAVFKDDVDRDEFLNILSFDKNLWRHPA